MRPDTHLGQPERYVNYGVALDVARGLLDEAIGGRFHNWTGPDTVAVDDVAEQLALSPRPADGRGRAGAPTQDHVQRWLAVRGSVPWHEIPDSGADGPVAPLRDGAVEDIRAFDGAIAPTRAQGLLSADAWLAGSTSNVGRPAARPDRPPDPRPTPSSSPAKSSPSTESASYVASASRPPGPTDRHSLHQHPSC